MKMLSNALVRKLFPLLIQKTYGIWVIDLPNFELKSA